MYVLATAGHVDHGKSTLIKRLTGLEPDRWDEERRRGLTIDLGFAWTELAGRQLAFVDVPGHERFVPNMLAGVGPVPAAMFVVAADEGWMAQSSEHLAAIDALGIQHGVLVVTKADRADPAPALAEARERIPATALGQPPAVTVSGHTGEGLDRLRAELVALADRLPEPDVDADVRLWVDRSFTVRGAGTVVTGTLAAGTLRAGDTLVLASTGQRVTVRGLEALGHREHDVPAVARVALNLRGLSREQVRRGDALLTPDTWAHTRELDVRLRGAEATELPEQLLVHIGAAALSAHVRPLGPDTARLAVCAALPLRSGDIGLLRDPGQHRVAAGIEVLDVYPPSLRRRGAAAARAHELAGATHADLSAAYLRRSGFLRTKRLATLGLPSVGHQVGAWLVDPDQWARLPGRAVAEFDAWAKEQSLAAGMPIDVLRRRLELPGSDLLPEVLASTDLRIVDGLVRNPNAAGVLPSDVESAVSEVERRLARHPFQAPEVDELTALGLGTKEIAAAVRAGRLSQLADGVVLAADAMTRAAPVLADLAQPFTVSTARKALGTTRRVAIPLLEALDAEGVTERLDGAVRICHATPA